MKGLAFAAACFAVAWLVNRHDGYLRGRRAAHERRHAAGRALLPYIPHQPRAITEGDCSDCGEPRTRNHVCKDPK